MTQVHGAAPTHEVATKLPSCFATFKVMFASAMTPEARLAVLKQYVVHPDVIQAAYAFFCSSNKHHRSYRAAMDAVQHQRLVEQQQLQPDGTTGVMAAAVLPAPTSAAPNGDTSAQQACEYLSTACAVDGVAVPGTMAVATDAPAPAGVALHEHFSIAIPRATQAEQHEAIVGLFNDSPAHVSLDVSAAAAAAAMADGVAVTGATDDDTNAAVAPPALQRAAVDGQPMATGDVQPRAEVGPGGDVLRIQTGSKPVALNDRRLLSMLFPVRRDARVVRAALDATRPQLGRDHGPHPTSGAPWATTSPRARPVPSTSPMPRAMVMALARARATLPPAARTTSSHSCLYD